MIFPRKEWQNGNVKNIHAVLKNIEDDYVSFVDKETGEQFGILKYSFLEAQQDEWNLIIDNSEAQTEENASKNKVFKLDDTVQIISGSDKGAKGYVCEVPTYYTIETGWNRIGYLTPDMMIKIEGDKSQYEEQL